MRSLGFLLVTSIVFHALPAFAGGQPSSTFNWTGFYVGANVGAAWNSADVQATAGPQWPAGGKNATADGPFLASLLSRDLDGSGFAGGAQIGYDYQIGRMVVGLEGSAEFFDVGQSFDTGAVPAASHFPGLTFDVSGAAKADDLFTLRPKIGFALDHWLFYGTGGLAVSDYNFSEKVTSSGVFPPPDGTWSGSSSPTTRVGWALGFGAAYQINSRWSLSANYLHADFGRASFETVSKFDGVGSPTFNQTARLLLDGANIGLNYRFGGPGG